MVLARLLAADACIGNLSTALPVAHDLVCMQDYLENEAMSQYDMNVKSQELYELWDDALNYLWGEIRNVLPAAEFEKLLDEQLTWIEDKEKAVEEAGKEVEGGSMYPLVVNSVAAEITEERVYDFVELLNNR